MLLEHNKKLHLMNIKLKFHFKKLFKDGIKKN